MAGIFGQKDHLIHGKTGDVDGNENIQGSNSQFKNFGFKGKWGDNHILLS